MKDNRRSVSRNGNQSSQSSPWPQPIPGCQGMGGAVANAPSLGAADKRTARLCAEAPPPDPRSSHGGQASGPGLFGLRLDGVTSSAPGPSAVRPVTQDPATAASLAIRIKQLRDRRDVIEVELDGVPIDNEHLEQRRQIRERRQELCEQIEAIETLGDGGPRLTVHLNDYASALVRRQLASEQGVTAEDVACAALAFMLGEEDDHFPDEEIAKATARRLGTEQKEAA